MKTAPPIFRNQSVLLFKSNLLIVCVHVCSLNQLLACVLPYVCLVGGEEIIHLGDQSPIFPLLSALLWRHHNKGHQRGQSLHLFGHKSAAGQRPSALSWDEFSRVCLSVNVCVFFVLYGNTCGQGPDTSPTVMTCNTLTGYLRCKQGTGQVGYC